ncbi:hypothetical protein C3K47_05525 [Solitalea longa]|uniref:DUF2029 domain-containing protein n=1 Tax=Solitalea longa TaxID=2079460 RepID=A0A2S5A617_9SPHI|nr:DUF2029 domain-containing protein [Solitalea longa]POY37985.1 hypothetical protein C3K47_05525 [Solitalea longa]
MKKVIPFAINLALLITLVFLSYFTQKTESAQLLLLFFFSFAAYIAILKFYNDEKFYRLNFWSSIILRLAVLFALPFLTQDFYRFVWDGQLLRLGFDPFAHRPESYMVAGVQIEGIDASLYQKLASQQLYSIYPPFCQSIFGIACKIFPTDIYKAVLVMKGFVFLFELGTIWMLSLLLKRFNLPKNRIFIYALNPLCIIEFCGNLHFDAGMIFFTLLVIYLLVINRTLLASVFMAMAFCIKLLPAIFIPLLLKPFGFRKTFDIAFLGLVVAAIFSLPFVYKVEQIIHIFESLEFFYNQLEFNASFYYLIKYFIFKFAGIHHLLLVQKAIIGMFLLVLLYLTFFTSKQVIKLPVRMMWALFAFLLLSPAVFPWYTIALLALGLFSNYRFPVIWTMLVPLSYLNYQTVLSSENTWIIVLEYVLVLGFVVFELISKRNLIDGNISSIEKTVELTTR